ncbi:MAG TPA: hypothetical protein VHS99_27615 [Chloroflexota bacterium]|nr:hypothetical protein [Chloroflexota bacterium]
MIDRIITGLAVVSNLLAVAAIARALFLLFAGLPWARFDTSGAAAEEYVGWPLAVVPLAAALLVLLGLPWGPPSRLQLPLAWAGLFFLTVFSGITIFDEGLGFLALAALLLPPLTVLQILYSYRHDRDHSA